jgi:hypothetical protein
MIRHDPAKLLGSAVAQSTQTFGPSSVAGSKGSSSMTAQTITAISAVVIALASLFVSIWTSAASRKHHRLSVTPHLRLDYFYSFDEPTKITLVNNGLGTAIITDFTLFVDGVALSGIGHQQLEEALQRIGLTGKFTVYAPYPDDALSAGENAVLLSIPPTSPPRERHALRGSLSRVVFRIIYQSMYGNRFVLKRSGLGLGDGAEQIVGRERRELNCKDEG